MTREFKRPMLLFGGFTLLFAAFVSLLLWALPGQRRAFDYMVAGTFATALALIVLLIVTISRRR